MNRIVDLMDFPNEVLLLRQQATEGNIPLFLVGGAVRDILARRPVADFDFAVGEGGDDLPWAFARHIGGRCFWLDRQRGQCRIVLKQRSHTVTFDFAPLHGKGILDDLAARDFTVNAIALDLGGHKPVPIDPLDGVDDLRNGVLRACSATSFSDDPLRLLRALRLAAALDLHIDQPTQAAIVDHARLIELVAGERVRDELFKILAGRRGAATFRSMHALGLLPYLLPGLPADPETALAGMERTEHYCTRPEEWLPENAAHLFAYLQEELESGVTIISLLKLASLLVVTREAPAEACGRFRLGRKAERLLRLLLEGVNEQFFAFQPSPGVRSMFRLFMDLDAGPELVLFGLIHHLLSLDLAGTLLSFYFSQFGNLKELLSGRDIQVEFGLGEGTELGMALRAVRAAERAGRVATKEDALEFLRRKLLTKDPS